MAKKKKETVQVTLNLTSMMDVVFQLIIFFLLVTNFSSAELPKLKPPELEDSQAYEIKKRDKIIVNIIPDSSTGMAKFVQIGSRQFNPGAYGEVTTYIEGVKAQRPDVQVDLRADASINYEQVQPVMNAITGAGIGRINLVAFLDNKHPQHREK